MRTVRGDVAPEELGPTYSHEHLVSKPGEHFTGGDDDLVLDDEARALEELRRFRSVGGGGLVDCTTSELGRDARALRRLSEAADVHIIAVTGHITPQHWSGVVDVEQRSVDELTAGFVRDLLEGMDGTGACAGAVKIGASLDEIRPVERRVMRAAAATHLRTGCPVTTHTTAGTVAVDQARGLIDSGVDPTSVCVGHLDRRLAWDDHVELARMGVFLGYDCLGKEQYQPDGERIRFICRLVEEGFADRICLGGDMARRSYLRSWGGDRGYAWIITDFIPRLEAAGLDERTIRMLLVDNPARHLRWKPSAPGGRPSPDSGELVDGHPGSRPSS